MDHFDRQTWIHVVIPVYNAKKYLKEAVDSVLNQPYQAIDIVLVDDGSTDGSTELCDEIARGCDRIHVIHQANGGVSRARNTGIEYILRASNGTDYIAFLDADDMWAKNFFSDDVVDLMKKHYDFIGFQSCRCNANCTRRTVPIALEEGTYRGGSESIWMHDSHFGAALYSRGVIKQYGLQFPFNMVINEDGVYRMQYMYLTNSFVIKNKLMYYYRQNMSSVMHKRKYGIPHYAPLIEGWLKSDEQMLRWKNDVRGELRQGRVLASIYVMDMIEEHYTCFGKNNELRDLVQSEKYMIALLDELSNCGNEHAKSAFHQLQYTPRRFKMKCYAKGIKMKLKQIVLQSKAACMLLENIKFPVKI